MMMIRNVCTCKLGSFLTVYACGSCFTTQAVILVSDYNFLRSARVLLLINPPRVV